MHTSDFERGGCVCGKILVQVLKKSISFTFFQNDIRLHVLLEQLSAFLSQPITHILFQQVNL